MGAGRLRAVQAAEGVGVVHLNPKPVLRGARYEVGPIRVDLDRLAKAAEVKWFDDFDENTVEYMADVWHDVRQAALDKGASEDEATEAGVKAEGEAQREAWQTGADAFYKMVRRVATPHHLDVDGSCESQFEFKPACGYTWKDVADAIRRTINGVGYGHYGSVEELFEARSVKGYRALVEDVILDIFDWPDVYEARKASSIFESYLR